MSASDEALKVNIYPTGNAFPWCKSWGYERKNKGRN